MIDYFPRLFEIKIDTGYGQLDAFVVVLVGIAIFRAFIFYRRYGQK
jgi:hypothetical protein